MQSSDSLEAFLSKSEDMQIAMSLSEYFDYLFTVKKAKKSNVITQAFVDPNYAYQLFNGTKSKPAKNILVRLCFALKLTIKEAQILLYLGNAPKLYVKDKRDSNSLFLGKQHQP